MTRPRVVRLIPVLAIIFSFACSPRLDEQQVRARLVDQLHLQGDQLRVVSITADAQPVVAIDYGGVAARIRFHRQDGVWVIDAVEQNASWQPADRAVPVLAKQLSERAHAHWLEEAMPRYARTLKLLIGWTDLISTGQSGFGFPTSQASLATLHAAYHRALFPNRGAEFHNLDLFIRDAWWRPFRTKLSVKLVEVVSSGADLRMDTADDMRLVISYEQRGPVAYIMPHYTLPDLVAEALGRADAPPSWNCSDLLSALKKGEQLDLVEASK